MVDAHTYFGRIKMISPGLQRPGRKRADIKMGGQGQCSVSADKNTILITTIQGAKLNQVVNALQPELKLLKCTTPALATYFDFILAFFKALGCSLKLQENIHVISKKDMKSNSKTLWV